MWTIHGVHEEGMVADENNYDCVVYFFTWGISFTIAKSLGPSNDYCIDIYPTMYLLVHFYSCSVKSIHLFLA